MRKLLPLALLAAACSGGDAREEDPKPDPKPVVIPYCDGKVVATYAPQDKVISAWPDDFWTVEDLNTPTKLRLNLAAGLNFTVPPSIANFAGVFSDLSRLDGAGVTAPLYLRVDGSLKAESLPTTEKSADPKGNLVLVKVGETLTFLPFESSLVPETVVDAKDTLIVSPLVPLEPAATYALIATQRLTDTEGGCLAPSATTKDLLDGKLTTDRFAFISPRINALVPQLVKAGTIRAKGDLSLVTVFTTQHTIADDVVIANHLRANPATFEPRTCTAIDGMRKCTGSLKSKNYRGSDGAVIEGSPTTTNYTIETSIWLPASAPATRTYLFAHGLGGDRNQGQYLAPEITRMGGAVIAIDAPKHGKHPDKAGFLGAAEFFGASLVGFSPTIDSRRFRDNLRQSAYDKLQLVQAFKNGVDVDGDGTKDLGIDGLTYVGLSLGGIMGPEFLAFSPETKAAVLYVAGARLTDVLRYSTNFKDAVNSAKGSATDGDLTRLFSQMQTAVDRGDPAAYGRHVLTTRVEGFAANTPNVLMQMVLDDDTVPNPTNRFFARSLGLPLAGDELQPMPLSAKIASLPASANISANVSAGVFQFDVIEDGQKATHNNIAGSSPSWVQVAKFLETSASGPAQIIDPYRTLQIKQ